MPGLFDNVKAEDIKITSSEGKPAPASAPVNEPVNTDTTPQPVAAPHVIEAPLPPVSGSVPDITSLGYKTFDELVSDLKSSKQKLEEVSKAPAGNDLPDDFIKEVVDYYRATGDLTPYLEAKTVDYTKLTDLEILRRAEREKAKHLPDETFERLFAKKLRDTYYQDENKYTEDDVLLGKDLISAEAAQLRQKLIDDQAKFRAPERPQTQGVDYEAEAAYIRSRPEAQAFVQTRMVEVKHGDQVFKYEVQDPGRIVETAADISQFLQMFETGDQKNPYNLDKWFRVAAYAADPDGYERALLTFGKSTGVNDVVTELQNPPREQPAGGGAPEGDAKERFLKEAIANRRVARR
jgi:hypothetical protein